MRRRVLWIVALLGAMLALGDGGVLPASAATSGYSSASICPAPRPGHATCLARVLTRAGQRVRPAVRGSVQPDFGPSGGLDPTQIASAYGLPAAPPPGPVPTIAIVDAFHYGLITGSGTDNLATYRAQYGIAPCTVANGCFRKVDQWGGTNYPTTTALSTGWDGEGDLDVDAVSAVCPACHILFVESRSDSTDDLMTAVATAVALGASEVSLSWGGSEDPGQTVYDPTFDHPGVAITAATGDTGYGASYPATSPYVTAVGGTTLTPTLGGGWTETAWSGGGSGCSTIEPKPAWQNDSLCSGRTEADVAAVADPKTGLDVYSEGSWWVFGGTSLATPLVAGMYALGGGEGPTVGAYPFYRAPSVHDIVSGANGSCAPAALCTAGPGFDGPTGLGSPLGPPTPVPSPMATNESFVHAAYLTMLGHEADPSSFAYWLGRLNSGTSRWRMAMALATSAEYRGDVIGGAGAVPGFYEEYLGRPSDPGGVSYWIGRMSQGTTFEQVRLAFLGSPEYFAKYRDDPGRTVDALYHDVLGRAPDPDGRSYWIAHFNATTIAAQILYSAEGRAQLVAGYYETYLGRAADAAGLAYWTQAILGGASDEQILAFVLSSNEFFLTR